MGTGKWKYRRRGLDPRMAVYRQRNNAARRGATEPIRSISAVIFSFITSFPHHVSSIGAKTGVNRDDLLRGVKVILDSGGELQSDVIRGKINGSWAQGSM
ncbi:hypothetical protein BJY04DRAFT_106213 [Aspergillus karnatakaensis]|uniref:uncharacterized protein n=1 Tax=Aspergillus karnatakaensis TaxID=1810916 RepID=UPI003CCD0E4B